MALSNNYALQDDSDVAYAESINLQVQAALGNRVVSGCGVTEQTTPDLTVAVAAGTVQVSQSLQTVTAGNVDLSTEQAALATGQSRFVYIYVDNTGTVQKLAGSIASSGQQYPPAFSALPVDCVLLARVLLTYGDTAINTADIKDMRIGQSASISTEKVMITRSGGAAQDFVHLGDTLDAVDLVGRYNGTEFELRDATAGGGSMYMKFLPSGILGFETAQRYIPSGVSANRYHNVAHYANPTGSVGGQMKITIPSNATDGNKDTLMITMRIKGYNYIDREHAWEIVVAGYTYNSAGPWSKVSVHPVYGRLPFKVVKFGNDGSNDFILLGEISTTWQYPNIVVAEVEGHYNTYTILATGWSISRVGTEPTTVYKTVDVNYIWMTTSLMRIENQYGYLDVGTQNSSYAHIYTDRTAVAFNKALFPNVNVAYDLGLSTYQWRDLRLGGSIYIGGDARLYRNAADELRTDDDLTVAGRLQAISSVGGEYVMDVRNTLTSGNVYGLFIRHSKTSISTTDRFVSFWDGYGEVGSVHSEVTYATFTGAHEGHLRDDTELGHLEEGMILCSVGTVPTDRSMGRALVDVQLAKGAKNPRIMGVYVGHDLGHDECEIICHTHRRCPPEEERGRPPRRKHPPVDDVTHDDDTVPADIPPTTEELHICVHDDEGQCLRHTGCIDHPDDCEIRCAYPHKKGFDFRRPVVMYNALGEGQILVTDEYGEVQNGMYVCTSPTDGIAMAQGCNILHNYTVAKITEDIDWDTVPVDSARGIRVYKAACTYHCG